MNTIHSPSQSATSLKSPRVPPLNLESINVEEAVPPDKPTLERQQSKFSLFLSSLCDLTAKVLQAIISKFLKP